LLDAGLVLNIFYPNFGLVNGYISV